MADEHRMTLSANNTGMDQSDPLACKIATVSPVICDNKLPDSALREFLLDFGCLLHYNLSLTKRDFTVSPEDINWMIRI